jgi:hypothetical protein
MLLAPSNGLIERFADCQAVLEKLLESGSTWGTSHSDFLPGVTYGLARALADELPSTSFLGRMLAFRLTGEAAQVGGAIVWFVEPLGTGQTLSNAVHELLRGQDYLQQLALRMDQMLAQGWDKSPLVDLARFWLPSRKRSAISNSERALIWSLAGKRKTRDSVQGPTGRFHLQCPHCQERWLEGVSVLTYSRFVMHCDKPIAMLVPTSGGQISTPAQLLSPWWPDELQIPNGSVEARVLAVWDAVATRVTYLLDKHQVEGGEDGWLPPEETWSRRVGDCEDHSLLMASMLRKLGISCWIVWGHANSGGHAWVEVQLGDRVALVEATRKLPLPANLPDAYDAESVREAYGDNYTRGLFEPFDQTPSRTNGTIYDRWADEQWHPIKMADPVPETAPPKP